MPRGAARHSGGGDSPVALAQVLQIVHGSYQMQVLLAFPRSAAING